MSPTTAPRTTCGPLYRAGLDHYAGDDPEKIRLFAAGFVTGQAEKVHLGAASGAMFRPSAERHAMLIAVVRDVAKRYDLHVTFWEDEIWIARDHRVLAQMELLTSRARNSPGWHWARARWCGVPYDEIDEHFHERRGAGERCD